MKMTLPTYHQMSLYVSPFVTYLGVCGVTGAGGAQDLVLCLI